MSVQLTTAEGKQRKKFTANQKLAILREWDASGNVVAVSLRHGIHPLTLYRWKKRLEQGAAEFLKGTRSKPNPEVNELQRENQKLKDTVTLRQLRLCMLTINSLFLKLVHGSFNFHYTSFNQSAIAFLFSTEKSLCTCSCNQRSDFFFKWLRMRSSASCITTFIKQGHSSVNILGSLTKMFFLRISIQ